MKQVVCELCGGTDLIKQDGVFVCQSCGTKYSVEEARKMVAEGTANVTDSTIKSDQTQKLENLRILAKRAMEENDSETAAKYFEQILLEDPNDWRANFYTIYYAAHNVRIAQLGAAANRVSNCFEPVLKIIKDTIPDPELQKVAYVEISLRVRLFKEMLVSNANNHLGSTSEQIQKSINDWIVPAISMQVVLADKIMALFQDYDTAGLLYGAAKKDSSILASRSLQMRNLYNIIAEQHNIIAERQRSAAEAKQEIEQKEKQKKRDQYWAEHADKKAELEEEKKPLLDEIEPIYFQIKALTKEKDSVPAQKELEIVQDRIQSLEQQRDSLGLFKGKEKKTIQEQIDATIIEAAEIQEQVTKQQAEIEKEKIDPLRARLKTIADRIAEINEELEKDR